MSNAQPRLAPVEGTQGRPPDDPGYRHTAAVRKQFAVLLDELAERSAGGPGDSLELTFWEKVGSCEASYSVVVRRSRS